jgi:hypothetical protein
LVDKHRASFWNLGRLSGRRIGVHMLALCKIPHRPRYHSSNIARWRIVVFRTQEIQGPLGPDDLVADDSKSTSLSLGEISRPSKQNLTMLANLLGSELRAEVSEHCAVAAHVVSRYSRFNLAACGDD